jgi:hypothetical protein
MAAVPELVLIEVVQCPECRDWFEDEGVNGILVHVRTAHPSSLIAKVIGLVLESR